MQRRRSLRLLAGALVLSVPLLTSCGFGKATDKVYTPAEGTNDRDGQVDILSAAIVAAQPNSGTFIATLSNKSPDTAHSLESVELATTGGSGTTGGEITFDDITTPVEVVARGYVNLADDDQGIVVRGEFEAGQFFPVTLTFDGADPVTMDVPVVFACDEWEGLDNSAESAADADPSAGLPEPGEPYDCAEDLYDEHSGDHTEPVV
jgi:hypothetical protein